MTVSELQTMLDSHCKEMATNMQGFLFYGILNTADGMTISKATASEQVSKLIEQGAAFHLAIVNQVKQVIKNSTAMGNLELDIILIETNKITFILALSPSGKFFSVTALDAEKCNIGLTRALLYKYKKEFGSVLENFFETSL